MMTNKKKILIIVDSFVPNFSPRMGYLALLLSKRDWVVEVITTDFWKAASIYTIKGLEVDVTTVDASCYLDKKLSNISRLWKRMSSMHGEFQSLYEKMKAEAERKLSAKRFDIILASAAYTPFLADIARSCSEKFEIPWIADFRDMFEQYPKLAKGSGIKKKYDDLWNKEQIRRRSKIIKQASACTCVSYEHREILSETHPNAYCVFNGYDSELYIWDTPTKQDMFRLVFGGKVYKDLLFQDPSYVFEAISILSKKKLISPSHFCFDLYLSDACQLYIEEFVERYEVQEYVNIFPLMNVEEFALQIKRSSICMLFTSEHTTGIMFTKSFEYIGSGRPILSVPDDKGCMNQLLKKLGAGCSASSAEEAANFILGKYQEWLKNGFVLSTADPQKASVFSRANQSEKFEELINQCLQMK